MLLLIFLGLFSITYLTPVPAYAAWTPLIVSGDFDGIKADVLTASGSLLAVLLVIVAVGLLVRVLGR